MTRKRLNFRQMRALVVDGDAFGVTLTVQMLHGLGLEMVRAANGAKAAQEQLGDAPYDLCICDSDLPDMTGADLVKWIRRLPGNGRFVSILVATGYSDMRNVTALRDAGAHLVVRKPLSPQVLYDRIAWVSRPARQFIESPSYVGPDRRFRNIGPPGGIPRRATDLSTDLGQAEGPNMSQDEIDNLMQPMRIVAE